ncbi:MAG TPA: hypothetical protein VNQ52_12235 [Microbacteriaceae bacterium]|nr:hypothetical protein [Microbacteriaceae bacterium]
MSDASEEQMTGPPPPAAARQTGVLPKWAPWVIAGAAGIVIGIFGTLGIGAVISSINSAAQDPRFAEAVRSCGGENVGMYLDDNENTLVLDVKGDEDSAGASYLDYACLIEELDTPGRVVSHIEQTTSMDGRQSEEWDGIEFSWSYHPDRGIDGVFRYVEP